MSSKIDSEYDKKIQDKNIQLSEKIKSFNIKTLSFSNRTFNALNKKDINTVGQLLKYKLIELQVVPNMGIGSIKEIFNKINELDDKYFQSLDKLGFSKNTLEVFHRFDISTIDELSSFDRRKFLSILYYGKKVYKEVNEFLKDLDGNLPEHLIKENAFLNQPISILDFNLGRTNELKRLEIQNFRDFCQFDFISNDTLEEQNKQYFEYIKTGLKQKLDSNYNFKEIAETICGKDPLKENYDKVRYEALKLRLRGDITLEVAGQKTKVTRERIRQIEKKAIQKLDQYLPEIHVELLLNRMPMHEPMFMELLSIKNNYFNSLEEYLGLNGLFIKKIFEHEYCHIQIEEFNKKIILSKRGLKINDVVNEIKKMNIEPEDISNYIFTLGRMDSLKLILQQIEENKPKSLRGKIKLAIEEIFNNSKSLLTISDLKTILKQKYQINPGNNQVNEAISNNPNIFLFGKNGWGHEKFFRKLDDRQLNDVGSALIEILILSKSSQRGRVGLLEELKLNSKVKSISALVEQLEPHDIDWVLIKINKNYPSYKI
jgi:hypothetical protein